MQVIETRDLGANGRRQRFEGQSRMQVIETQLIDLHDQAVEFEGQSRMQVIETMGASPTTAARGLKVRAECR